jgi:hypothetical protein
MNGPLAGGALVLIILRDVDEIVLAELAPATNSADSDNKCLKEFSHTLGHLPPFGACSQICREAVIRWGE